MKKRPRMAAIGYTQFYTDVRVIREAQAAVEAGFALDMFALREKPRTAYPDIHVHMQGRNQYKGKSKARFIFNYISFFFYAFFRVTIGHIRHGYKVIHVHNMPNFLVFACLIPRLTGAKIILDIHDVLPELFAEKFSLPLNDRKIQVLYFEERISGNFADVVISTNRLITERLRKNGIRKKVFHEILNAADEGVFRPFNTHDFNAKEIIVIFPSTIAKRLGLDILIDAIKLAHDKDPRIRLRIFGMGEYAEDVTRRIGNEGLSGFISFPGLIYFDQLNEELEKAHIGVLPWPSGHSTNFQMPIKVHEYFIKGLCVIASDVSIICEYFKDEVILFDAGNAIDLSEKILKAAADPQLMQQYASAGNAYAKIHSWDRYKKEYIKLITSLTS